MQPLNVQKAGGVLENWQKEKLKDSLVSAGADDLVADEIALHIEREVSEGMSTKEIYRHAHELLSRKHTKAAYRYSLRHAIMELGPTGFPFEEFIAHVLRAKGFETLTGQTLMGGCVPHEVDIVAWNENKLIFAEAKFHNEQGIKSDLKVVLYVRARMDDLAENTYNFGFERRLDEGWLITNTKFTDTAITYAKCKNLKLIGWNYPSQGNLLDLIADSGLHPLTCLASLTNREKQALLASGTVLCKELTEQPDLLRAVGLAEEKVARVLSEIAAL